MSKKMKGRENVGEKRTSDSRDKILSYPFWVEFKGFAEASRNLIDKFLFKHKRGGKLMQIHDLSSYDSA